MKNLLIVFLKQTLLNTFLFTLLLGCREQKMHLTTLEGKIIPIDSLIATDSIVNQLVLPYKTRLDEVMDEPLAFNPKTLTKNDGELNSSLGNLMADLVRIRTQPLFKNEMNKDLDMVLLNHGGIRAVLSEGWVTTRSAFQIMPFENYIVVAEMKGEYLQELIQYLVKARRAHPISGLEVIIDIEGKVKKALINGQDITPNRSYYVGTSDYLIQGGDHMSFFQKRDTLYQTNYLIRNAMIDYFKSVDTIRATVDQRFIKS